MTYTREISPKRATRTDMIKCLQISPVGSVFRDVNAKIWVRVAGGQYVYTEPKGTLLMLDPRTLEMTHGPIRRERRIEGAA